MTEKGISLHFAKKSAVGATHIGSQSPIYKYLVSIIFLDDSPPIGF